MRLLWLSHLIPYPPKSGVHLRAYHLLRATASKFDVDLVAFVQNQWLKVFFDNPDTALAESRDRLGEFCSSVTFLPIDKLSRPAGKARAALEGLVPGRSYSTCWLQGRAASAAIREIGSRQGYSVLHCDTLGLAWARQLLPSVRATLGHHNIESHMMLRRAETERSVLKKLYFWQEGHRLRAYEKRVAGEFAAHIVCSQLDGERLRAIAPDAAVTDIPNGVDVEYFRTSGDALQTHSIVFVGSLNWYPNVDAVLFLLREIWPEVSGRFPDLVLEIVGSSPPPQIVALGRTLPNVTVRGFVDDVRPLMDAAKLYVCPIRDGGGTKLKLLDAFAMGKCVIAHPVACEGIDVSPMRNVIQASTAQEFIGAIGAALGDSALRARVGAAARRLVEERYGWAGIGARLQSLFLEVASAAPAVKSP